MRRESVAVIGSGIAGLASAWLLRHRYAVTLYERNHYLGGHSHTVEVSGSDGALPVDTGFIVYNERNYPHLTRLFAHLGLATRDTDMSFAASIDQGRLEYAGSDLNTLFAQRGNLVSPAYWGMLRDILRFNRLAKASLRSGDAAALTLGAYLDRGGFGQRLRDHYLLPMAAAIWSCPTATMTGFPAESFLRFFDNHGLLDLVDRPQWRTVVGGSRRYVTHMAKDLEAHGRITGAAERVQRANGGVWVHGQGAGARYDHVVLACHADEALALIDDPTPAERAVLGAFAFQENQAVLHTDERLMPRRRRVWSAWNYLAGRDDDPARRVSVTYWMNRLQHLPGERQFFVSLNPLRQPREDRVIAEMTYHHPVLDQSAAEAQVDMARIQGRDRLWFAGAWLGYGFHEDGLRSAVRVAEALGAAPPWQVPERVPPARARLPQAAPAAGEPAL